MITKMKTTLSSQVSKKGKKKLIMRRSMQIKMSKTISCQEVKKIKRSRLLKRKRKRLLWRTGPSQSSHDRDRLTGLVWPMPAKVTAKKVLLKM